LVSLVITVAFVVIFFFGVPVMLALFRSLFHFIINPLCSMTPWLSKLRRIHASNAQFVGEPGYAYTDKEWKEYVRQYPFLDR